MEAVRPKQVKNSQDSTIQPIKTVQTPQQKSVTTERAIPQTKDQRTETSSPSNANEKKLNVDNTMTESECIKKLESSMNPQSIQRKKSLTDTEEGSMEKHIPPEIGT